MPIRLYYQSKNKDIMRTIINFNGNWKFHKTATIPEKMPSDWEPVTLPHTWNAADGQDGGNDYWRGTAMYAKAFSWQKDWAGQRVFLEFPGAAMTADVTLNGKHLAHHTAMPRQYFHWKMFIYGTA